MEFITTYQMPLIFGGLLIIMALIGYEADKHQKEQNGEKPQKKKKVKKGKNEVVEEQKAVADNIAVTKSTDSIEKEQIVDAKKSGVEVSVPVVEQPQVSPVQNVVGVQTVQPQVQNDLVTPNTSNDTLSAFKELNNAVQNNDTFGVNDMSSFQVQPNEKKDTQVNSVDAWKL